MKKLSIYLFMCFALLLSSSSLSAQVSKCCGNVTAPELTNGTGPVVDINATTSAPTIAVPPSGLPNYEYLIMKRGVKAGSDPDGDMIIGTSNNGMFVPKNISKNGITLDSGDIFDLIVVGFDLPQIKTLADSLLNGKTNGQSCCGLFPTLAAVQRQSDPTFTIQDSIELANFCDTVRANGINGSNDINNLGDVLVIFESFSDTALSAESLVDVLGLINENGNYISTDCGGLGSKDFLKYGVNIGKRAGNPVPVERLGESKTNFMVYPNPARAFVQIRVTTEETTDLQVNVYSTMGAKVHSDVLNGVQGNGQMTIDVSTFASGVYYIELTDGLNKDVRKMVVR